MKKLVQILVLGIFLAGCSSLPNINIPQLIATPTAPPPAAKQTPFASQTPIPTQNLFATSTPTPLTFTPTVTSIGAELFTPTNTAIVLPTATPGVPLGAASINYFTPQSVGFITILYSYHVLYWDEGPCMPREVKISAFVEDLVNTDKVLLFMRLRSKKNTVELTDWGAGAIMLKADNGSFNYNVRTFNLKQYYYFTDAWLEYQLVAFTDDMQEIGRTPVYDRNITLARCGLR
ncbi:MAG: hypothetical protein EHM33_06905 [Chloroflexi bacterium]|nr:MAG: hypothetical protein EHM33_06905 [Chloroflexota bacterium]